MVSMSPLCLHHVSLLLALDFLLLHIFVDAFSSGGFSCLGAVKTPVSDPVLSMTPLVKEICHRVLPFTAEPN